MIANRLNATLYPSKALRQSSLNDNTAYESFDNDPFLQIEVEGKKIKAGWYVISYNFKLHKGKIVLPKIYFDFGDGYSEKYHWKLFFHGNEIFGLVKVPWDCFRLRLDLSEENIQFESGEFKIKRVNKVHATIHLFTLLHKLGVSRSHFLKELLYKKNIKDKKKLLKSVFEGNYLSLDYQRAPVKNETAINTASVDYISELLLYSSINKDKYAALTKTQAAIEQYSKTAFLNKGKSIDIVLPVYNGLEYLEKLLPQIINKSDLPFNLYLIDDCSPDIKLRSYLNSLSEQYSNIHIQRNEVNLGFTKTVNKLLKLCTNDIIVLLNSDIEVPSNWLSKLIKPMLIDDKIGTITPISNCATICSFPNMGDNPLLTGYDVEEINLPLNTMGVYYEEIPTGVGFCMAINKRMVDKIGHLNEEAFPRGYGEEVDLCFRARKSGYRNVLNTGLFVYHKHGGSFDNAEKIKLLNENQQKIERMHPDFTPVLQRYFKENTFILIKLVYFLKLLKKEGKRISLFLDHDLGGGTNQYSKNYLSEHESSIFLYGQYINPNRNPGKQILFSINYKNYHFRFGLDTVNTLFQLIGRYTISLDEIIINNLVSYNNALVVAKEVVDYKKIHNTSLKVLCHDFYYICPNFLLFINNTEFCGVPEEVAVCNKCISSLATSIDPKLIPNDFVSITQWRTAWKSLLLDHADIVVMFSESTKAIFTKVWPSLEKKSVVIPHSLKGFKKYEGQLYRIGILGNIHSVAKGAKVVQDLAAYIERNNLYNFRLINFGGIHPLYDHNLIEKKGPYTLDDIHYQLLDNKIDVILIPSVCSETFSFTTREAIETGIPTACFKIGGQYDQIKNYNKGIVAGEIRPEAVLEAIINYFKLQKNEAV